MFERESFVAACRRALREHNPQLAMKEVVEQAISTPAELERAFGPPKAGMRAVYKSPELHIFHVVWAPEMRLYPHDHRMWAVIGIYGGQEDNTFYRRASAGIEASGGKTLVRGETVVLGEKTIHAVANPRRAYTGALHIYAGDYLNVPRSQWDPGTLQEQPFSFERLQKVFADAEEQARKQLPSRTRSGR